MVVQRHDGPRRLREIDDDESFIAHVPLLMAASAFE